MSVQPVPILVLAGGVAPGSTAALAALAAGALEVLSKDTLDLRDPDGGDARAFRRRLKMLSGVRVLHHPRAGLSRKQPPKQTGGADSAAVIGICASAGGPQALARVLAQIPAGFRVPILVVQHIASGFTAGFADWLAGQVPLAVALARAGQVQRGISVAPDGAHLALDSGGQLILDERDDAGPHRPSADVLLRSIAASAGADGVAVVLTGMGRDGADGLGEVGRAGGLTIAQDEASSAVFGMPKQAAERGAQLILGPEAIGQRLRRLHAVGPAT